MVAFLTVISKLLGFLRETSLAAVFGATSDTDAYLLAQTIPYLLFATVSYALTTTFIPVYSHVREARGKEAGFRFANTVILVLLVVGIVLVLAGEALAEQLVRLVAPGLDESVAELTEYLSRILFPMTIFQLLSGVVTGILQADGEFGIPTAAGLAQNIAIIISIIAFGPRYGIPAVAVGTLIGLGLSFLVKLPALARTGFRWRAVLDIRDPGLQRIAILMLPALLSAGANQVNTLVDRMLASGLPEGRVAALNYANRLMQLAPGIIGTSVTTVIYPTLAKLAARKDWERFNEGLVSSLSLVHFLLIPIAVGILVLREPLVRIVYERGAFDAAATQETAWTLLFFSIGIAVFSMRNLISRAFFTLQDTKTPLMLGIVTVGTNVVLNLLLVGPLEQGGLALASVISMTLGFLLGLIAFRRKARGRLDWRPLVVSMTKTLASSIIMGVFVKVLYPYLDTVVPSQGHLAELTSVVLAAMVGAAIYISLTWMLQVPELRIGTNYLASLISRGRRSNADTQ